MIRSDTLESGDNPAVNRVMSVGEADTTEHFRESGSGRVTRKRRLRFGGAQLCDEGRAAARERGAKFGRPAKARRPSAARGAPPGIRRAIARDLAVHHGTTMRLAG
jgi:hypothetical protein